VGSREAQQAEGGGEAISGILRLPREGTRDLAEDLGNLLANPSSRVQSKTLPCTHSSCWKAI